MSRRTLPHGRPRLGDPIRNHGPGRMMNTLTPGLTHSGTLLVEPRHTVPGVAPDWPGFVDMPPVLATAMLVGFMEHTCLQALRPYLLPGQHSVGVHVDMDHTAATPVGMTVTAEVAVIAVEGRTITLRVACRDEAGPIGQGTHRRAVIDLDRFMAKANGRTGQIAVR